MPLNLKTLKVWSYFDLKKADEAQSKHCPKILLWWFSMVPTVVTTFSTTCTEGGSTVRLKRHLEKIHDII